LPAIPKGWWNESMLPSTFEIWVPGSQAVLEVNPNISIDVRTAEGKRFLLSEPRPARLAILGEHGRFVIGNMLGELRVWDSASRQSISLLGSHGSRITSLDYCRIVGLIAADASGQIKRWDTQSGAQLASWRGLDVPVQSARLNAKGNIVAALLGSANRNAFERTLVLLDAEKLTVISTSIVDGKTALVLDIENHWTCVGWNGSVAGVHGDRVSEIPKECVESLLFSPTSELFNTSQPFPHAATAVVQ